MKKIIINLIFILTLLLNFSFATTTEYIEFQSGEVDDGSIYIDSYEDYLDMMQGVDEQAVYKEEYDNMIAEAITNYDVTNREKTVKALVLSVKDTEEYYYEDYYGVYKIKYQPIKIQILEGKYKNKEIETTYVLTLDSYENIDVKEIKANQKINVVVQEDAETNEIYAYPTTVDAAPNRFSKTIILLIITLIAMLIYLGKKVFKVLPQLILLADIILLIFVPELLIGRSIIWLTLVTMIAYLITNTAIKVGLNAKAFASILSTVTIIIVTTMSGLIYEVSTILETFPKGTINFSILSLSMYMLMVTILSSEISCKVINIYNNKEKEESRNKIKEYVSEKILTVSGILLITIIPKYLCLLISKYTLIELLNSEMLTVEIIRILFLIMSSLLTIEVAICAKDFFVEDK